MMGIGWPADKRGTAPRFPVATLRSPAEGALLDRPVSLRMPTALQARIVSTAERKAPIPDGTVSLYWPDVPKAIVEPRREALLRSIDQAATCVLVAKLNRDLSTKKQVLGKLRRLAALAGKTCNALDAVLADDLASLELSYTAERISDAENGLPLFPPRHVPSSKGGFLVHQHNDFLEHLSAALHHSTRIAQSASRLEGERSPHERPTPRNKAEGVILAAMSEDDPRNAALRMIYFAWVHVLRRRATATVDWESGNASGPFLDFAAEMALLLRFKLTPERIRGRFRRMKYMP
jgi:HEPN domain-containing protein